jgi:glutathione S-transferase
MLDDGKVLTEGPAIAQFLADSTPDGARMLPPQGTFARNEIQSYLNFITSELHKPMAMLFSAALAGAHDGIRATVEKRLDWLSGRMAGPYLTGEDFTIADAYLFVCLNWVPWIDIDLDRWPTLQAFRQAVAARPSVQAALEAEELYPFEAGGTFFAPRSYIDKRGPVRVTP